MILRSKVGAKPLYETAKIGAQISHRYFQALFFRLVEFQRRTAMGILSERRK